MMRFGKYLAIFAATLLLVCPVFGQAQQGTTASTPSATPVRTIEIQAKRFEFVPSSITLKKGETVKLELTSDDVTHSLLVPGLGIDGKMTEGHITDVVVTPTKVGDFSGRCAIYCGKGHRKMGFVVHVIN